MTAIAVIIITEQSDGAITTLMNVDNVGSTKNERQVSVLMDKAIGAGMSAVTKFLHEKYSVESCSGSASTMEQAIENAINAALTE